MGTSRSSAPEHDAQTNPASSWLKQRSLTELLALAGVFAYGVTFLACVTFYGSFGVEPSDVGLGYTEMLAQAGVFLALFGAPPLFATLVWRSENRRSRHYHLITGVGVIGPVVLVGFLSLYSAARAASRVVERGEVPPDILGLLPWDDVEIAGVRWLKDADAGRIALPRCVVRLGEASGTEVFYDPRGSRTIRIPQSAVVVTIRHQAERC